MTYDLVNADEFISTPLDSTDDDQLYIYRLNASLDNYPISPADWEYVTSVKFNSETLSNFKVNGESMNHHQLLKLVHHLKSSNLVVNGQGLCFVRNFMGSNQNSEHVYLRLVDAFNWPDYGVKSFKFSSHRGQKYLEGSEIAAQNR